MALTTIKQTFRRAFGGDIDQKGSPLEAKSTLSNPDAWLFDVFGATPVESGATVTPRNAMRCTAVRCAVQAIAEAIGQLPVHTYRRGSSGARERAPDHPAHTLLHDEANDWTPAADFREQLTRDALLWGNGYAFINRVDGKPVELVRLNPETATVEPHSTTGEPVYRIADGRNARRAIHREDVLHIRAPSLDGLTGESPVRQAREAIGLAIVMETHAARLFGNGARPSGLITFPNNLTPDAAGRAKAAWKSAHGGSNSGGTAVLDNGASWKPLALTSTDAQFLELRKFAIEEIARAFRVPPVFLMDYGRATWSNSEEMGRQFVTFTLLRWLKAWEGEIRLKLIAPEERGTYYAEFLIDDLLRADIGQRMEAYSKAISARVLNPNEARAMENRPPYAGGERFENPNTTIGATGDGTDE